MTEETFRLLAALIACAIALVTCLRLWPRSRDWPELIATTSGVLGSAVGVVLVVGRLTA